MEDRMASVEQSLARLEVQTAHLNDRLKELLIGQTKQYECLTRALNGDYKTPGLFMRTDRLETWHKGQLKVTVMIFTVLLPLVATRLWDALVGS